MIELCLGKAIFFARGFGPCGGGWPRKCAGWQILVRCGARRLRGNRAGWPV